MRSNRFARNTLVLLASAFALSASGTALGWEQPKPELPKVIATIPDPNPGGPYILDVNKETNRIYVANYDDNGSVSVIDGRTDKIIKTIQTGGGTNSASVNERTNRIYATNYYDGTVSVIDGYTNKVINTIPVGSGQLAPPGCDDTNNCTTGAGPYQAAVNPRTNKIYVDNYFDHTISVIDGGSNKQVTTIKIGNAPYGIVVNSITNRIYDVDSNGVTVTDGRTNTVMTTISVGANPLWVAVNEQTNRVYVANNNDDTVSVIDGRSNKVIDTIPIPPGLVPAGCTDNCTSFGSAPAGLAVSRSSNTIYVTDFLTGALSLIDGYRNQVLGSVTIGSGAPVPPNCFVTNNCTSFGSEPFAVAVNDATRKIYVLNLNDRTISVLRDPDEYPSRP